MRKAALSVVVIVVYIIAFISCELSTDEEEISIDPPGNIIINLNSLYVSLDWDSVTLADSYNIYRSVNNQDSFSLLENHSRSLYYDDSIEGANTYYYYITFVEDDTESSPSSIVSIYVPTAAFEISNQSFQIGSLNCIEVTGLIKNIGDCSASYVRITYTMYKQGEVVDTDFTYAVIGSDFEVDSTVAFDVSFNNLDTLDDYDDYDVEITFENNWEQY